MMPPKQHANLKFWSVKVQKKKKKNSKGLKPCV